MKSRIRPEFAVAVVYVAAMFMNALDTTVVNVALPTLGREFNTGTSGIEWVVTGYLLSLAAWIPASGWIGDKYGNKRIMLAAIAVFTITRLACAGAQTLPQLIVLRIIQGAGGGMMIPVGLTMLMRAFPPDQRARISRLTVIPTVIGPASGPVIGGLIVDSLSWRWIFALTVPLGIAAFIFGAMFLREHKEPRPGAFDLPGFVLSASGLASILFALSSGPQRGWDHPVTILTGAGGVLGFTLLVFVELNKREPMLQFRLIKDRLFRQIMMVSTCSTGAFLGLLFLMPQYLQQVVGTSATQSGLTTFPEAVGVLVGSQFSGRAYLVAGPRRLMASGLTSVAVMMFILTRIDTETSLWLIRGIMFFAGFSMAFVFIPMQAAVFARIAPADTGQASAIFSAQRQVASALGVAVLATVLSVRMPGLDSTLSEAAFTGQELTAFRTAFLTAGIIAAVGACIALFVRDRDAAATMRKREPTPVPVVVRAK